MNTVLVMLLVPAISILASLNLALRDAPGMRLLYTGVVLSVLIALGMLFIALPFRRWCRRKGKNHVGWWLLQWWLVMLPAASLAIVLVNDWYAALVVRDLLVSASVTALASWFLTDCRPFKPLA